MKVGIHFRTVGLVGDEGRAGGGFFWGGRAVPMIAAGRACPGSARRRVGAATAPSKWKMDVVVLLDLLSRGRDNLTISMRDLWCEVVASFERRPPRRRAADAEPAPAAIPAFVELGGERELDVAVAALWVRPGWYGFRLVVFARTPPIPRPHAAWPVDPIVQETAVQPAPERRGGHVDRGVREVQRGAAPALPARPAAGRLGRRRKEQGASRAATAARGRAFGGAVVVGGREVRDREAGEVDRVTRCAAGRSLPGRGHDRRRRQPTVGAR